MITLLYLDEQNNLVKTDSIEKLKELQQKKDAVFWLDMENMGRKESEEILTGIFKFHPLAVEDCINISHHPKMDDYCDYLFIIVHGISKGTKNSDFHSDEINIFVGKNYIVTFHDKKFAFIDETFSKVEKNPLLIKDGPATILYNLMSYLVETYTPVIESLDKFIDNIENEIFKNPTNATLNKIFQLKRKIMRLKRISTYQREVFLELSHTNSPLIDKSMLMYFRDVYDHLLRLSDLADSYRDTATSAIDIYLSAVSNRLNSVMKVLTIIATIMMPLTFIAGIYGMNFEYMPELKMRYGYYCVLGFMGVLTLFMLYIFKKKDWL